jgi:hypothetical protein
MRERERERERERKRKPGNSLYIIKTLSINFTAILT